MITASLGVISALIFGAADFIGGIAAKRLPVLWVTVTMALSGLLVLLIIESFVGGAWTFEAVVFGGASGLCGALAVIMLYRCLAIGPMGVLSPITAVVSAIFPVGVEFVRGTDLGGLSYFAIVTALFAVVLVSVSRGESSSRPTLLGILLATGSGLMIGGFYLLIDLTPDDSGFVPLIANRATNATFVLILILLVTVVAKTRTRRALLEVSDDTAGLAIVPIVGPVGTVTQGPGVTIGSSGSIESGSGAVVSPTVVGSVSVGGASVAADGDSAHRFKVWQAVALVAVGGAIDIVANVLMLVGFRLGDLSVMSVLVALYPAGTIILAAIFLKERFAWWQGVGMVLAIGAAAILSVA